MRFKLELITSFWVMNMCFSGRNGCALLRVSVRDYFHLKAPWVLIVWVFCDSSVAISDENTLREENRLFWAFTLATKLRQEQRLAMADRPACEEQRGGMEKLWGWMKESWGGRDQVINTANGAQWKLCKPKGTDCRMLQCATPAERTGTEVSTPAVYFHSILLYSSHRPGGQMFDLTSLVIAADFCLLIFFNGGKGDRKNFCLCKCIDPRRAKNGRRIKDDIRQRSRTQSRVGAQNHCSLFEVNLYFSFYNAKTRIEIITHTQRHDYLDFESFPPPYLRKHHQFFPLISYHSIFLRSSGASVVCHHSILSLIVLTLFHPAVII